MTRQEHIALVIAQLPRMDKRRWKDRESLERTAGQCYDEGWSLFDTITYCLHSEECSPRLSEEYALSIMNQLARKYRSPKEQP